MPSRAEREAALAQDMEHGRDLARMASSVRASGSAVIHDFAAKYQEITGVGLPFSKQDDAAMFAALLESVQKREQELKHLRKRDFMLREFIKHLPEQNNPLVQ